MAILHWAKRQAWQQRGAKNQRTTRPSIRDRDVEGYSGATPVTRMLRTCAWIRGSARNMSFTGFGSSSMKKKIWTLMRRDMMMISPAKTSRPCRLRILPSWRITWSCGTMTSECWCYIRDGDMTNRQTAQSRTFWYQVIKSGPFLGTRGILV